MSSRDVAALRTFMGSTIDRVEFRSGSDADLPAVLELMRVALSTGSVPCTHGFWTWKHRENPFGASPMRVACVRDRIVGVRLFMRWQWTCEGQPVSAVRAVDTATHPQWRRRGIFHRLTTELVQEASREGVAFVFNTPNERSRPGYLRLGWTSAGRVSMWVRPRLFGRARSAAEPHTPAVCPSDLGERIATAHRSGLFAQFRAANRCYRTRPTDEYFLWRYVACPARRYGSAPADPARALLIYDVHVRRGLRELKLCELLVDRSWAGVRAGIEAVRATINDVAADYAISALTGDATQTAVLAASGFVPAPRTGPVLIVRELADCPSLPDPRKRRSMAPSIGDLELF